MAMHVSTSQSPGIYLNLLLVIRTRKLPFYQRLTLTRRHVDCNPFRDEFGKIGVLRCYLIMPGSLVLNVVQIPPIYVSGAPVSAVARWILCWPRVPLFFTYYLSYNY